MLSLVEPRKTTPNVDSRPLKIWIYILGWSLLTALLILYIAHSLNGNIFFTLDDPYIHMAVGHRITQGGYGINLSEYSSPSSSIIWPYLMAATETMRLAAYGPLFINLLATGATIWIMLATLDRENIITASTPRWLQGIAAVFCILIINALALPLTGMEHSLHVLLTMAVFSGLLDASRGAKAGAGTVVALVFLPLVRFEGMAFTAAAIAVLVFLKQGRPALVVSLWICLGVGAYVISMLSRGLPVLPSSVLMKSAIAASAYGSHNPLGRIVSNIRQAFTDPEGLNLVLVTILLAVLVAVIRPVRNRLGPVSA